MNKAIKNKKVSIMSIKRVNFILFLIFIFFIFLFLKLVQIKISKNNYYIKLAEEQYLKVVILPAERGIIYDRNLKMLALNIPSPTIYVKPNSVKNIANTADALSVAFPKEKTIEKIKKAKESKKKVYYLYRKTDERTANLIKSLNLSEIGIDNEPKRYYPEGNFASNILGYTNMDIQGVAGVEKKYNEYLAGKPGKIKAEIIPRNIFKEKPIIFLPNELTEKFIERKITLPENGKSIVLTIDENIQSIAETELDKAIKQTKSKSGCIIVMHPETGEILAGASYPNFNPNAPQNTTIKRNIMTQFVYEPGSTFKIFTIASALQEKVISKDSIIHCSGFLKIKNSVMQDHEGKIHKNIDIKKILAESCNTGVAQIALLLGKEKFYANIMKFGFGEKTKVDLPEEKGIVHHWEKWRDINLANIGFGQGISTTPLQILTAFCSIVNGGNLITPRVVKKIIDEDGNTLKEFETQIKRQNILDKKVLDTMKEFLYYVVEEGTGKNAKIEGYKIAGKTATAQKPEGGKFIGYITSFIGCVPVDNPKIAILVLLDEPKGKYYASDIACPVFREVARKTLLYLNIPPDNNNKVLAKKE